MKPWRLLNAVARAEQAPLTFLIPDMTAVLNVKAGDFVKVGFENPEKLLWSDIPNAERFWLEVTETPFPIFVGRVANDPLFTRFHGQQRGSMVHFSWFNLLSVEPPPPGAQPPQRCRLPR